MMTGYVLVLEVISGSNLIVPSHRIPAGLYVMASTAYGQYNTATKIITAEYDVHWNDSLTIQGRPLVFPQWLMPIFPNNSKIINLEIRASFETVMLGRGEVMCRFETTLQELLVHGKEFTIQLPGPVAKTPCPSLVLKARRVRPQRVDDHGTVKPSEIDLLTDAAHEAYALYRTSNQPNDLDSALKGFRAVLDRCPDGHPQRAPALSNLGHVTLYGFTKGVQTDIDHAISLFCSALTLRPQGHPDHPLSIFDLCKAYYQRYLHLQDHTDLRKAVKLYIELLPNCPQGSYLQVCVIEECNLLPRNPSNESISLRRMILDLCPRGHQYHARSLNRLAGDLYTRFEQSSNIDYINEAVHLSREALTECSGDGERSFFLSVLSYTLKLRFHRLRSLGDIDECIELNREALSLRPPGHPGRQKSLNNLARALKARYDQCGNTADWEEAIHLDRVAHDLRSETSRTPPPPTQHSEEHLDTGRGLVGHTPQPQPDQQELHSKPISSNQQTKLRNVVIFGESGSGKSSVINAIAQHQRAQTSSSAAGCTFRYEKHKIDLSGEQFVLFDTVGLDEGTAGTVPAAEAVENLKNLLRELMNPRSDGIGLLVYCVRSVRISRALLRNYNLFYSSICRKKVPIVVVVTGLENQEPTMDSWWDTNEKEFRKYGMQFKDHACVTTLREGPNIPDVFTQRIIESSNILRSLILENYSEWVVDERWFKLSLADVRNMISDRWDTGRSSPRTLVICDPAQKDVEIASGIHCAVETCFVHINGEKYQVHSVTEPKSPTPISNIESDLLIYYVRVDEQDSVRQRFRIFCAAYRGNVVPVIVVVQGLDTSKAAEEWIGRHIVQNDTGRPFAAFIPAGDFRDRNAEQELRELIRQSCLVRSGDRGEGVHKSLVNVLGRWL